MVDHTANLSYKLLLETAQQLIEEKGCRNTTLQQIMLSTGLSKGAIYHYVKSKEELFGLILASQLEVINTSFHLAVAQSCNLTGPLLAIAEGLVQLQQKDSVANQILTYLLSQKDKPGIPDVLQQFHERSTAVSLYWIETGQREGVIDRTVDARKAAEQFVMLSYGMCIRNIMLADAGSSPARSFEKEDFYQFMLLILQGGGR
ncbi:MAG TPA: helix-turn-helix domain-containing protein [Candidatus Udaeobacter sp.]|nr:helix-turn-helix domain-containing protein [Candidatus Udaeobacter sp.]